MGNCLFCCQPLEAGDFHPRCSEKFFGVREAPELPYDPGDLETLAKETVLRSITVPGVQVKLSLRLNPAAGKGKSRFTIVGLWGNFILKPPVSGYPHMPEIEDCTMRLAGLFDIPRVPHSLIQFHQDHGSGAPAYITRRIDRDTKTGGSIHMEDFCQLSGKPTEQKYRGSLEGAARIIRRYSSNSLFDVLGFFEVNVFSFLTGNADMHLKNFSLLHNRNGMISLAPAYDLIATRLLISEKEDPEEFALSMNGKKRKLTRRDFLQFGTNIGLSAKQMDNSFKKFSAALSGAAPLIAASFLPAPLRKQYQDLVHERAARLGL